MKSYRFTARFEKAFGRLPEDAAELFLKKLPLLLVNMRHPSLRVKKMLGLHDPEVWEGSLSMDYRFTFQVEKDGTLTFRSIGHHGILDKEKN